MTSGLALRRPGLRASSGTSAVRCRLRATGIRSGCHLGRSIMPSRLTASHVGQVPGRGGQAPASVAPGNVSGACRERAAAGLALAEPPGYTVTNPGDCRMTTEETVVTSRDGRVGRILLNRPRALNALDLSMIRACAAILETWRNDPACRCGGDRGRRGSRFLRRRRYPGTAGWAVVRRPGVGGPVLRRGIRAEPDHRDLSEALYRADRRDLHGRRHRPVGACAISRGHRTRRLRDAGDRDRLFPGYRRHLPAAAAAGRAWHLSRPDRAAGIRRRCRSCRVWRPISPRAPGYRICPPHWPRMASPRWPHSTRPLPAFSLAAQRAAIDHCFSAATVPKSSARLEADGRRMGRRRR